MIRAEWDALRKHDIVFLLTIRPNDDSSTPYQEGKDFRKHFGIKYIRGAEIIDVIGKDGNNFIYILNDLFIKRKIAIIIFNKCTNIYNIRI